MKAKFVTPFIAALMLLQGVSGSAAAAETHNVTILDFDGNVVQTLTVPHGQAVDLSSFDTSSLTRHLDVYTEQGFSEWMPYPDKITADTQIRPLYKKMKISYSGSPAKKEYYSAKKREIDFTGLKVVINVETQIAQKKADGSYGIDLKKEIVNITDKCTVSPAYTSEAFKDGKTSAEINVYPILEHKAIFTFRIDLFEFLGDFDMNGACDADDSSNLLRIYADYQTGNDPQLTTHDILRCDVNRDGAVDSGDASLILAYYSLVQTGDPNTTWDEFLG